MLLPSIQVPMFLILSSMLYTVWHLLQQHSQLHFLEPQQQYRMEYLLLVVMVTLKPHLLFRPLHLIVLPKCQGFTLHLHHRLHCQGSLQFHPQLAFRLLPRQSVLDLSQASCPQQILHSDLFMLYCIIGDNLSKSLIEVYIRSTILVYKDIVT